MLGFTDEFDGLDVLGVVLAFWVSVAFSWFISTL